MKKNSHAARALDCWMHVGVSSQESGFQYTVYPSNAQIGHSVSSILENYLYLKKYVIMSCFRKHAELADFDFVDSGGKK